jgi:hypothetical protein
MSDLRTPVECFTESKESIMAIPNDKHTVMNMPIEEAMQEGRRVAALVEKFYDTLINTDINPELLKSIFTRAGAFAYCVSVMDSYVKIGEDHSEKYKLLKKEGYAVRSRIVAIFEYVFRNDSTVLATLNTIREGRGDFDMIRDNLAFFKLGSNYKDRLSQAKVDFSIIDRANSLYQELADLTAELDIDPEKIEESKLICAKAYTYLWEAVSEIYLAGRFAFFDQPEIEELFYSDYRQKIAKKRAPQTEPEEQPEPAVAG